MIRYDPLFRTMKRKKITAYRLFKMGFSSSTYYAMRHGNNISSNTIDQLCRLLHCQVSDILEYYEDEDEEKEGD